MTARKELRFRSYFAEEISASGIWALINKLRIHRLTISSDIHIVTFWADFCSQLFLAKLGIPILGQRLRSDEMPQRYSNKGILGGSYDIRELPVQFFEFRLFLVVSITAKTSQLCNIPNFLVILSQVCEYFTSFSQTCDKITRNLWILQSCDILAMTETTKNRRNSKNCTGSSLIS